MKKIYLLLIFILTFFNTLFAEDKTLKIAITKDMVPYTFLDESGQPQGVFIDYWNLWSKKTNTKIEFVPLSWGKSVQAVENKTVDIHSGLFKNDKREKNMTFIKKLYISQAHIYTSIQNESKIKSSKNISGKNLGLLSGTYYENFIKKNYPLVNIKRYDDLKGLFQAIKKEEIDFFIDDSLIIWFQLISNFSFNKVTMLSDFQLNKWFYSAVKKDDDKLKKLVYEGMNQISEEEIIQIEKKWIIEDSFRYFEQKKSKDFLTYEERLWLLKNPNINIAVMKDWERFSIFDKNGKISGFHVDLINQINKNLKLNLKLRVYNNWSEAYEATKRGETLGLPGLSWSKQREDFFNYSPSYHYSPYFIIARKDSNNIKSIKDFNHKTAVTYTNSITNKLINEKTKNTKIIHRDSVKEILKALENKEADVALLESAKAVDLDKYSLTIVNSVFSKYSQLSIGVPKKEDIFASIITKGINSISDAQMKKLKNDWLDDKNIFSNEELFYIRNSKVLKVGVEDWTAIIGMKEDNKIVGVGGELAQKAFDITGLYFEYVKGSWDELLQDFKDGKIDILPTTLYTKQRDEYGDFSKQYLSLKNYIYVKSDNKDVKSLKDLNFKKIAIQKDFATGTLLKEKFPNIQIVETKDLEESIQCVLNGDVDALFEIQISVENKMREFLITNLKSISQNSIKSQGLHIFLKEDELVLKSIINKSLEAIPEIDKNHIVSKWLNTLAVKRSVNAAFANGRDPYTINNEYMKGIEYDLVRKILDLNDISLNMTRNMSHGKLENILFSEEDYDIAVGVKENKDDNFIYSDPFIEFRNIIVTRKEDNINIKKVSDLKNKKIIAFKNAYKYLGDEYFKSFNPKNRPESYYEYSFQEEQVKDLLHKKVDVIILDRNIFKWFLHKLGNKKIDDFHINYMLSKPNEYKVAFKDKNLRDVFNKNLKIIKNNGDYKEIIDNYIEGLIESKIKINFLVSSAISEAIYKNDFNELKKIVKTFSSLPYINKIEVYDKQNNILSSSSSIQYKKSILQDSYYLSGNIPQKVGFIKVYFNNTVLKSFQKNYVFVPDIDTFSKFKSFKYIKNVYKKFGYLNDKVSFTQEEMEYIKNSRPLKIGIDSWKPVLDTKNEKELVGLAGELVEKAFKISGLKFEYIKDDWNHLLEGFKVGKYDILPATVFTDERSYFGTYSNKYLAIKNYIYVKSDTYEIKSFSNLENKKLAIQKGFGSISIIKKLFPNIKIIETKSLDESIQRVLNNEVDALFELQIAVENHMREHLITNLKSISQNSIKSQGLHMFMKKDDLILESIINKSLKAIPHIVRNKIISKWINPVEIKKEQNILFAKGREPFVLSKDYIKGIDYDLVKKVLSLSSTSIKEKENIYSDELKKRLKEDTSYNIAVNVDKKDDGFFYSEPFVYFDNVIVSRKIKNYSIENIWDLKNKRIIAFKNAYKYLGKDYNELFNLKNRSKNYIEMLNQRQQVKNFLENKVDLIVIDKNIFKWFFNKLSNDSLDEFVFHNIFPNKIPRYIAFKDKKVRDVFNINLKEIHKTGEYEEIFNDYTQNLIESKIKISSLIATLVSKYIFLEDKKEIDKILKALSSLPYIKNIEVFNNLNERISRIKNKNAETNTRFESYYLLSNVPRKVGYIKVYFDNKSLKNTKDSVFFIPNKEVFKKVKDYKYIEKVYTQFGYFNEQISFTKEELKFLESNRVIKFSSSLWQPLSIIENRKHEGLFSDYLELISNKTGLEFEFVESENWMDVLSKFKNKEIDMIPGIGDVSSDFENGLITNKLTEFKYAIVANKKQTFLDGLADLQGKSIAVPKGYSSYKLLSNSKYNFDLIETKNEKEALSLVASGEVDAFVGHSAIAIYNIKNNFPELKIVGLTDEKFKHRILVQDKHPLLLSIFNKVIFNISPKEKQDIKYKWIQTEVSTAVDNSVIYKIVAVFVFILTIILIFTRKLSQAKKEIELTNQKIRKTVLTLTKTKEELIVKSKDLEEQKDVFETLFYDTSDGLLLIQDNRFIQCNNASLKILGYESKENFLSLEPHEISPEFQPDGEESQSKAKRLILECLKNGSNRFEWIHLKSNKEKIWLEIVLTKIILDHDEIIHVVWRDISDKKALEKQILKRNNDLEDSNHELEVSIDNLKQTQEQLIESEKMASLGGLVAGVAHEINTPIGIGLTGATHFMEISKEISKSYENDTMTQKAFEEYLSTSDELATLINSNLKRAANLVKSFKQVAVDQTSEEKREFNFKKYIHEVLSSIHSVTKKTKLDIFVSCDESLKINSYPGAFSQVLTNLIMNSIIHGYEKNEKGLLSIIVKKIENEITIIYKDDGVGIPKENINKIFDPFFTTNRENGGSGLGLNIIYNIITTKLNGKIKYTSEGKGVEFTITFKV